VAEDELELAVGLVGDPGIETGSGGLGWKLGLSVGSEA
jgi:hypothetical protein